MPASEDWDLGFSNVVYVKTKASNDPTPGETVFVTPIVTPHISDHSGETSNGFSPSQNYTHYEGTNSVTINLQPTSQSILSRTPPLPVQRTRRPTPLVPTRSISHREPHEVNPPTYSTYRIIRPSFSWNTTTSIPTSRSNSLPPLLSSSPRHSFSSSSDQLPSTTFGSRLRQPRRSVIAGTTYGCVPTPPSFSRRYSCDYGQSSYMPTNISSSNNIIQDVKVPSSYYSENVSTLRRPSFSKPVSAQNGDVSFTRRPSLSRATLESGEILSLRRPSFSRPATVSSISPSLHRRASVEPRPHTSLGHSTIRNRYLSESDSTNETQSRPTAESYASLRNRTQQAKDKIKYHQQLMDRYLPANLGPVGDVRYDVEYKFVELADRMPEFEAYRSPSRRGSASSMRSAVPSRAGSRERSPYIPQTPNGAPKVSEARQKIRQVLRSTRSTSVNKDYNY